MENLKFEDYIAQVENSLAQLNQEGLPLDQGLRAFADGCQALGKAKEILQSAEGAVLVLSSAPDMPVSVKKGKSKPGSSAIK